MFHRLSKIFSSMSGYHNQTAIRCPFQIWMRIIFSHSSFQCINRSITSHENCFFFFSFFKKIILRKFSWCKIKLTNNAYCLTVKLFWIWAVDMYAILLLRAPLESVNRNMPVQLQMLYSYLHVLKLHLVFLFPILLLYYLKYL